MSVKKFGTTDTIKLRFTITKRATGGGHTGLTPTIKIVDTSKVEVTPVSPADQLTEVNATAVPGRYEFELASGILTAGQEFDAQVNPNNNAAVPPELQVFEILSGVSSTAPPGGDDLTTLANVNALVGTTTAAQDTLINSLIGRTSSFIQTFCHRKFAQQAITEIHDGDNGDILFLRNPPIQSLTTVLISTVSKDVTKFEIATNEGYITSESFIFDAGRNKINVTYQGGFAALPAEIVDVATEMVAFKFNLSDRRKIGLSGEQAPDGSRTFFSGDFMQGHLIRLEPYVLRWTTMAVA